MDCVSQILNFYQTKLNTSEMEKEGLKQFWLSQLLIKIMNSFAQSKLDNLEFRNCLILLVNLFSDTTDPDFYSSYGMNARNLSQEDKCSYKELLLDEFQNS